MFRFTRKAVLVAVSAGLVMAGVTLASTGLASAGKGNSLTIGEGPDFVYVPGSLSSARATVTAASLGGGNSQIAIAVEGIDAPAGTTFGAHVHVNPCGDLEQGGGASGPHYYSEAASGPLKNHEVWLDFTVNANGSGHAVATRHFEVSDRANRSVIIHVMGTEHGSGAAGARLACIDLDG
jgi:Cu-Zn family superoxide dismutase